MIQISIETDKCKDCTRESPSGGLNRHWYETGHTRGESVTKSFEFNENALFVMKSCYDETGTAVSCIECGYVESLEGVLSHQHGKGHHGIQERTA